MFIRLLTITRNTFTEAIRQPIYVVLLIGVILLLVLAQQWAAYTLSDDNKLLIDMGLSSLLLFGTALAAFIATGVISREVDNKTVLTVISKPVGRPVFIVGKYLGVMLALSLAFWIWAAVFLLTVRHKVMQTAADPIDGPVLGFGLAALGIAVVVAVFGNYFYQWVFASTFAVLLAVTLALAMVGVLVVGPDWQFQSILHEFSADGHFAGGQILIALLLVLEALWMIGAVAVAASTRLGQVMTLLICLAVFVLGGMSDWLFGRLADTSAIAAALYRAVPNIQPFFLADALTQNSTVTLGYVGLTAAYAALITVALLALAVALFQTRETG